MSTDFVSKLEELADEARLDLEEATDPKKIKSEHEGITDLPNGAWDSKSVEELVSHFIKVAKKKGKGPMAKAVNNIQRWNKNRDPKLSNKARDVMDALKASEEWKDIPAKG